MPWKWLQGIRREERDRREEKDVLRFEMDKWAFELLLLLSVFNIM